MRERVWHAAHVGLKTVTLDTDTSVHTVLAIRWEAAKATAEKQRQKQLPGHPHVSGEDARIHHRRVAQRRSAYGAGDRATLKSVFEALPTQVETIFARADPGFYCGDAVAAHEGRGVHFLIFRPEAASFNRAIESGRVEGVAAQRCRQRRRRPRAWRSRQRPPDR